MITWTVIVLSLDISVGSARHFSRVALVHYYRFPQLVHLRVVILLRALVGAVADLMSASMVHVAIPSFLFLK